MSSGNLQELGIYSLNVLGQIKENPIRMDNESILIEDPFVITNELRNRCDLFEIRHHEDRTKISQLEEENQHLRQEVDRLGEDKKRITNQLREALGIKFKKDKTPSDPPQTPVKSQPSKKRGAPLGHYGDTRSIPKIVDREEIIEAPKRCQCGSRNIAALDGYDVKFIEDLPRINRVVTRCTYFRGRCLDCNRLVRHPKAVTGPPVEIGPHLKAQLALIRQMGVSLRKLSQFSTETLGIPLSPSGVMGVLNKLTDKLNNSYSTLELAVKDQRIIHGDETGWKVDGSRGYVWCFCNKQLAYFHYDPSRGAKVVKTILGDDFEGILVCDFYAAYNCINKTQRCLIHLLRDIRNERKIFVASVLLEKFEKAVKDFIIRGVEIQSMAPGDDKDKRLSAWRKTVDRISKMPVIKGKTTTLVKRIVKYRDDIVRFAENPQVEYHNNRAERQIRPLVILRKTSFGSRTTSGAKRICTLFSIIETCRLNNEKPIDFLFEVAKSGKHRINRITQALLDSS